MKNFTEKSVELLRGPTGRAIAQPMENGLLEAIYEHITMERNASAQYFAFSLWFSERELRGFSSFYGKESQDEQEHASIFCRYLIARGQTVLLEKLPSPKQDFNSIQHVVEYTFQMEADVTSSLHQLYSIAERSLDTRTTVFLDPVIEKQISAEDETAYLLGRVNLAGKEASSVLIIDNELYNEGIKR